MNVLNVTKLLKPVNTSIEEWHFLAETDGKATRNVQHGAAVKCRPLLQIHTGHNTGK
jgi:hypothetical protein